MARAAKLMFVVTEDWFFASHFLHVAEAARRQGYEVSVHVRIRSEALKRRFEDAGLKVLPSTHERGHFGLLAMLRHVMLFHALFRRERPDIVHVISVRLIVLAGFAARLAGVPVRIHAVTGMGFLAARTSAKPWLARRVLGWLLRGPLGGAGAAQVFENAEDPASLGIAIAAPNVLIVGGAGIDPDREPEQPWPEGPPLKVALVARMIASKGVDVAVEAMRLARRAGRDVTLTLVGAPDTHNPRTFSDAQLEAWSREPGVRWLGHTDNIQAVWREHHVACVPSRGGEGLPRSLLEGAAAGRAILTTQTPGCATFTRDGLEGRVVPPGEAAALAEALGALAADLGATRRMGQAARARVLDGFTREAVTRAFLALYRRLRPPT